jgi:hypothetical protein
MCAVRLALPAALIGALALALASSATAAPPVGAPEVVRVARAGDEHQRPRALTEWWQIAAIGPGTTDALRIRISRGWRIGGVDVTARSLGWSARLGQTLDTSEPRNVHATGTEGTTTLRRIRGGWELTMAGPLVSGRLVLERARPGPTALRWRLGEQLRWPRYVPVDMSWSALAATSRVTGSLTVGGTPIVLDGWRASLEHVWGRFNVDDDAWEFLNAFTIHQRRGGATLAFGLNRSDTTTGPGARDAQWLGVLARVRDGRTRLCRPIVHRRRWRSGAIDSLPYALDLRARCGGMRVAFRSLGTIPPVLWGATGLGFYEYSRPATATGGGRGSAVVWGHDVLP